MPSWPVQIESKINKNMKEPKRQSEKMVWAQVVGASTSTMGTSCSSNYSASASVMLAVIWGLGPGTSIFSCTNTIEVMAGTT